jgi:hypothetical protein
LLIPAAGSNHATGFSILYVAPFRAVEVWPSSFGDPKGLLVLRAHKAKYDPKGHFFVHHGVKDRDGRNG